MKWFRKKMQKTNDDTQEKLSSGIVGLLEDGYKICKIYRCSRRYIKTKEEFCMYLYLLLNKEGKRKYHYRCNTLRALNDASNKTEALNSSIFNETILPWLSGYNPPSIISNFDDLANTETDFFKQLQGKEVSTLLEEFNVD